MSIDITTHRTRAAGPGKPVVTCAQELLARLVHAPRMAPTVFLRAGDELPSLCC